MKYFVLLVCFTVFAQEEKAKPRVFITDSQSWELSGGFAAANNTAAGRISGGAKPQTAEVIKTFGEKCEGVTITMKPEKADYVVLMEHSVGGTVYEKDNKYAVFKSDGDSIKSGSTRTLGNAVKDACKAIVENFGK